MDVDSVRYRDAPTATMSAFRPNYKSGVRRLQREQDRIEAERKIAEETERRKYANTDANFPTLGTARPVAAPMVMGTHFASLAEKWAHDDEVNKKVEEMRRLREETSRLSVPSMYVLRSARSQGGSVHRPEDDEFYREEEEETSTAAAGTGLLNEDAGWTVVTRKVRKPKRELTIEEMEARDMRIQEMNEANDEEFNGDLHERDPHGHDRV